MDNQNPLIQLVQNRITGDTTTFHSVQKTPTTKKSTSENQEVLESEKTYKEALAYIKDVIAPEFMKVQPNQIQINNTIAKTFFVYSYPTFLE